MANCEIKWCISELMNLKLLTDNWPVDKELLTSFVDILISKATAETGISIKDIKEYNKEFYDYIENYFNKSKWLSLSDNSKEFSKLCFMFKLPTINNSERSSSEMILGDAKEMKRRGYNKVSSQPTYTHTDCLKMFNKLSPEEQVKFVLNFQNIEIKLSPSDILVIKSL